MDNLEYNYHTHTSRCGHAFGKDEEYVDFLKLLTRVCYSYGPSTTVKFTIYNINTALN